MQGPRVLSVTYSLPHSSENWSQAHIPQLSRTSRLVAVNLAASANSVSPGVGDPGLEYWLRVDGYFLSLPFARLQVTLPTPLPALPFSQVLNYFLSTSLHHSTNVCHELTVFIAPGAAL